MGRAVRSVLRDAADAYADDPVAQAILRQHQDRVDEPLRVAVAGKMKAGKSTLLNALVGEEIAPTDAGECTRIVTWYEYAPTPRVTLHGVDGKPAPMPVRRTDGRLNLELAGRRAEDIERLVVEWPSRSLQAGTLIDTPGIDSMSTAVSARTTTFLTPSDEPSAADAIVYLLRHLHSSDVRFLESFHDQAAGRATMVNTVGVLSRADEIGAGRWTHWFRRNGFAPLPGGSDGPAALPDRRSGGGAARADRADPAAVGIQRPAGAGGLPAGSHRILAAFCRSLRSQRCWCRVEPEDRERLLDRLGVFGVRLSITMIRAGLRDATALSDDLVKRSGLGELRRLIAVQFTERRDLLKARSALLAVDRVIREQPRPGTAAVGQAVERILAGAHEFRELRLLGALRAPGLDLEPDAAADAERLLGGQGPPLRCGSAWSAALRRSGSGRGDGRIAAVAGARRESDDEPGGRRCLPGGHPQLRGRAGRRSSLSTSSPAQGDEFADLSRLGAEPDAGFRAVHQDSRDQNQQAPAARCRSAHSPVGDGCVVRQRVHRDHRGRDRNEADHQQCDPRPVLPLDHQDGKDRLQQDRQRSDATAIQIVTVTARSRDSAVELGFRSGRSRADGPGHRRAWRPRR